MPEVATIVTPVAGYLRDSVVATSSLVALAPHIELVGDIFVRSFRRGGRVFFIGNGGSMAEAMHQAAEYDEKGWALGVDPITVTATANDYGFEKLFEREVHRVHVGPGDVVVGYSTSGKSENVVLGLKAAKLWGAATVAMTGRDGGPVADAADTVIRAPATQTTHIQELHTIIGHAIHLAVTARLSR